MTPPTAPGTPGAALNAPEPGVATAPAADGLPAPRTWVEARGLGLHEQEAARQHEKDPLIKTWHDPPGLWGALVTVQNGPIVDRFMFTVFVFFLFGGLEALLMRTQLAVPENGFLEPQRYNQLFSMHGSTMMFLFATPMMEAFAEFLLPAMLGARELPFPRMTAFLYWLFALGGGLFYAAFFFGTLPDAGWTAYMPLSNEKYSPGLGLDFWNLGLSVAQIAAIGDAIELLIAIFKMRAPGMALDRMPLYLWSIVVMCFMIIFGFTPLLVASGLLQLERHFGTHFFDPAAGGDPVLWQHLFWFFGHPDVYVMFIPATGMASMILATFARRPVAGYSLVTLALVATGFMSFGLWVHHMFAVGLPSVGLTFFTVASMLIAVPSGIQVVAWIVTLWKGRPLVRTPLLFVLGFIGIFVVGGVTGVMVGAVPFDWQVHDTFFLVAHFHYVLIGGVVFPSFGALYYWLPKMTGKLLSERLGRWNFWTMFAGFNLAFFPMHVSGLLGMPRRVYTFQPNVGLEIPNLLSTIGAYLLGLGVLLFIVNYVWSIWLHQGAVAGDDPWRAGSLEWAAATPPPTEGYRVIPIVHSREPLWHQTYADEGDPETRRLVHALAERPTAWRATLLTTIVDAAPEGIIRLAPWSVWPLVVASLVVAAFGVELLNLHELALAAVALMVVAIIIWLWPPKDEREFRLAEDGAPTMHGLPLYHAGTRAPGWWGMLLLLAVCGVATGCLLFSYFYLRVTAPQWPQGEIRLPRLLPAALPAGALAGAALAARVAEGAIRNDRRTLGMLGLGGALTLGGGSLVVHLVDLLSGGFTHETNAYGSVYFALAVWHDLLAGAALILTAVVLAWAALGYFNRYRFLAVQNTALCWYFLLGNGLLTLAVLHLTPYVF